MEYHQVIHSGTMVALSSGFKAGVTNIFETASYFLCTDRCKGLLVCYKLMK